LHELHSSAERSRGPIESTSAKSVLIAFPQLDCPSSILVRALVDDDRANQISWVTSLANPPDARLHAPRVEYGFDPFRRPKIFNSLLFRLGCYQAAQGLTFQKRIDACAEQLKQIVDQVRPRAIWGLADYFNLPIVEALLKRVDLPLHLTVHDEPACRLWSTSRWPHQQAKIVSAAWRRLVQKAASLDAVSEGMQSHLLEQHGRSSVVIPPTPRLSILDERPAANNGHVRIGLSGAWFGFDRSLLALKQGLQRSTEKKVCKSTHVAWVDGQNALRQQGVQEIFPADSRADVSFLPRMGEQEAVTTLAACQVLFLPFWHDNAVFCRTSNPSKLCIYLPAARPMIIHGPEDSVPVQFARRHKIGVVWNTLDPRDFVRALEEALAQLDDWPALRERYERVCKEHLSLAENRRRFWQVMDATIAGQRQP
jgi:hypothetical protein